MSTVVTTSFSGVDSFDKMTFRFIAGHLQTALREIAHNFYLLSPPSSVWETIQVEAKSSPVSSPYYYTSSGSWICLAWVRIFNHNVCAITIIDFISHPNPHIIHYSQLTMSRNIDNHLFGKKPLLPDQFFWSIVTVWSYQDLSKC